MKKFLFMAMMVTLLASCSKDDEDQPKVTYATVQDIQGTWTFQNPLFADVIVEGSDSKVVEGFNASLKEICTSGKPNINIKITFNADKTCDVLEFIDGVTHTRKGTYRVENGRLYFKYKDLVVSDEAPLNTGLLEKRNDGIYFVWDKQALVDQFKDMIARPNDVLDSEREENKARLNQLTEKISKVYVPFKMVKN
jgi:hypothetical protein